MRFDDEYDDEYDEREHWRNEDDEIDYWQDAYDNIPSFADPRGGSALRAETPDNPRIYPCPTCGVENVLTAQDVELGYQCNACAQIAERGW